MAMIIAVSDVHLGTENSNSDDFLQFLKSCENSDIDHLVLLGDIMDFWRRNNAKIVIDENNAKILDKIARLDVENVHYIAGNHDYYLLKLFERYGDGYPFSISKSLRLKNGGRTFYFIHGYELEVLETLEPATIEQYEMFSENMCFAEDMIGGFASSLWCMKSGCEDIIKKTTDFLKKPPNEREKIGNLYNLAISKGAYILLGMKPDEYLVYGHTHRPYLSDKHLRANTGAWVKDDALSEASINTYVRISDGEVKLRKYNRDPFP
jgi:UDP-2,3-diacylglucosamine pyrophosphatase LpxH